MPVADSTTNVAPERVNELYWGSERTVDEIVKDLGISRSALYSAVRPEPSQESCSECGGTMVFANRTSREAGVPACLTCAGAPRRSMDPQARSTEPDESRTTREPPKPWARWREDLAAVPRERAAMVGGAAALGVVFGATAAKIIQEMR